VNSIDSIDDLVHLVNVYAQEHGLPPAVIHIACGPRITMTALPTGVVHGYVNANGDPSTLDDLGHPTDGAARLVFRRQQHLLELVNKRKLGALMLSRRLVVKGNKGAAAALAKALMAAGADA